MVAVRHRPITALGARLVAAEGLPAGVNVRLFGEISSLPGGISSVPGNPGGCGRGLGKEGKFVRGLETLSL